jgi:hypothetical protein
VKCPITQFSPVFCYFHFHSPKYLPWHPQSVFFPYMTDQVSHPRITPCKITVLYIYILKIANGNTFRFWTECQEITEIVKFSEFIHTSTDAQNIMLLIFSLPITFSSLNCRKYVKHFIPSTLQQGTHQYAALCNSTNHANQNISLYNYCPNIHVFPVWISILSLTFQQAYLLVCWASSSQNA